MIDYKRIEKEIIKNFKFKPFSYTYIDNFLTFEDAKELENQFPDYDDPRWFVYDNPLENKKALNNWNESPQKTYQFFLKINSSKMISVLEKHFKTNLFTDPGLHGGGWHIHGKGGNLNPHLDYTIHPKCGLQRKINIIFYLSSNLIPEKHKGHLGFWSHNKKTNLPLNLEAEVAPIFNRAVIFDTSQNSWHGISKKLELDNNIYRKSLANYYLTLPENTRLNKKAIYAPTAEQANDKKILETIKKRANENSFSDAYITK